MTEYAVLPAEETPTVDYTALRLAAADPGPAIGPAPGKVRTVHIHSDPPTFLPSSVLTRKFLSLSVLCVAALSLCSLSLCSLSRSLSLSLAAGGPAEASRGGKKYEYIIIVRCVCVRS